MISSDFLITKSFEDKLNRESFAKSIANVILQSTFSTSFTVGLYGAWGSGKTSLLNMVIEQVEHSSTEVVIFSLIPGSVLTQSNLLPNFLNSWQAL